MQYAEKTVALTRICLKFSSGSAMLIVESIQFSTLFSTKIFDKLLGDYLRLDIAIAEVFDFFSLLLLLIRSRAGIWPQSADIFSDTPFLT